MFRGLVKSLVDTYIDYKFLEIRQHLDYISAGLCPILLPDASSHHVLKSVFTSPVFNPSIVRLENNQILCIARSPEIFHYRKWRPDYRKNVTEFTDRYNALYILDQHLNVMNSTVVDDQLLRKECKEADFGIEDIRLFKMDGHIWGIGTGMSARSEHRTKCTPIMVKFENSKITDFKVLNSPVGSFKEKNWIPVFFNNSLEIISSFNPLLVLQADTPDVTVKKGNTEQTFRHVIRGGTNFVPWGEYHLGIIHFPPITSPTIGKQKMLYTHSFILLSNDYQIIEISNPFFFFKRDIEFAVGLIDAGDSLIVSFGLADKQAIITKIHKSIVGRYIVTPET